MSLTSKGCKVSSDSLGEYISLVYATSLSHKSSFDNLVEVNT